MKTILYYNCTQIVLNNVDKHTFHIAFLIAIAFLKLGGVYNILFLCPYKRAWYLYIF